LRKKDEDNREGKQGEFKLRVERLRQYRQKEPWLRKEEQKEKQQKEKQQWMKQKELLAKEAENQKRLNEKEKKQQALDCERVVRLGEKRYPNRPDLEAASRRLSAWREQQEVQRAKMLQEVKRQRVAELQVKRILLEDELECLDEIERVNGVLYTKEDKEKRRIEILKELDILELEEKRARAAL
jgi:hypothetical protein